MIERTQVKVSPEYESDVTAVYERFGWNLIDAQEFYNESTSVTGVEVSTYGDGFVGGFMRGFTGKDGTVKVNQRTSVTNYVTLRFSRDTNMYGYGKLVENEKEYFRLLDHKEAKKPLKRTGILIAGLVILIISIFLAITEGNTPEVWEIIVSVVFAVFMIPFTLIGWKKYSENVRYDNWTYNRMAELINEAEKIVDGEEIHV